MRLGGGGVIVGRGTRGGPAGSGSGGGGGAACKGRGCGVACRSAFARRGGPLGERWRCQGGIMWFRRVGGGGAAAPPGSAA